MTDSAVAGYDIIGDVHGCADALEALLAQLGYEITGGTGEYRHPSRQAVFVGDLIDRGPGQLRVLQVVKAMADAGSAQIVMGNHEFNALGYHHEHPAGSGKYLRTRNAKHTKQHQAFLDQLTDHQQRHYLDWFATLPLWLDLDGLRVVHACWHKESMDMVQRHCGSSAPFADTVHLVAAHDKAHKLYDAIENLLKGSEISLVKHGLPPYQDKDGHTREEARTRWWNSDACTLRDIVVMSSSYNTADGEPYPQLPEKALPPGGRPFVYTGEVPVFYGHYWRQDSPTPGEDFTGRTACVDFSAVNGGTLTAYRWSGEDTIDPDNYAQLR
ncbi:metallophosphoesterase [Mycolicibacter heraklionensis]|uniref:metallophosphoesterase n=1 Tax=Mycolicibacter heraklionensis TaxID=512402 RepID=UPI0007EA4D0A|nr:metallophosphoesterase [Mycolicibacter heraklionensis]OBG35043.1 metallophosphatase [Mycolicibacter heraklionensis]